MHHNHLKDYPKMVPKKFKKLREAIENIGIPKVNEVRHDIDTQCKSYGILDPIYQVAWDYAIYDRLKHINGDKSMPDWLTPWHNAIPSKEMDKHARLFAKIKFGQIRAAKQYLGHKTVGTHDLPGFPVITDDDNIDTVVPRLGGQGNQQQNTIDPDAMPIQISWSPEHGCWIALNNRGYAAHCKAGKRPLRLWPRPMTQDEANRLNDNPFQKGQMKDVKLPSDKIAITVGPSDLTILETIEVPAQWR